MSIPEEQLAVLEAEVAEVLGILEGFDEDGIAEGIRRYAEQVERIGSAAGGVGLPGLQKICRLFGESLMDSGIQECDLGDAARERLEEWPTLVIGYLMAPEDPQAGEALLDHLHSPIWNRIPPAAETEVARRLLTPDSSAGAASPSAIATEAFAPILETSGVAEEQAAIPEESVEPLAATVTSWTEPTGLEPAIEPVSWTEPAALEPIIESAAPAAPAEILADEPLSPTSPAIPSTAIPMAIPSLALPITEPEPVAIAAIESPPSIAEAEELASPGQALVEIREAEAREESGAEAADQEEIEASKVEEEAVEEEAVEEEAVDPTFRTEGVATKQGIAQRELLEILCAEVAQIAETTDETLAVAASADSTPADRAEALAGYAETLERLGDAASSIGLAGLQQVCTQLRTNLNALAIQESPLNPAQRPVVETWPDRVLNYLNALEDRTVCASLAHQLQDTRWPEPLGTAEATALIDLLLAPTLITEDAEAEARPQQARPEDISLELPDDVNQQLLDGLLQELPHQAADFSTAIQRLAAGDGTLKDVEVAQRIAHTLKGAGNTVGVRGIATLTHQVEDILQALSKHGALPNRPLASTLVNASDCLEMMSEALLGISPPPNQALDVLQEVLDWANRIDHYGIPATDEMPLPEAVGPTPTQQAETAPPAARAAAPASEEAPSPEAILRIPARLVDDLLRLVGESIILTGQVRERVRKTIAQTQAMLGQNRTFQQLTAELEQLVDVRNVSSPLSKSIQRGDFDPLELEQYNELNTVTHRLVEAATDARELNRTIEDNLATLDSLLVDQNRLHRDSQEAVLRTRMVPIQTVVPRLQRSVRQTCRLVNKEVDLMIRGVDTLIDSHVLNGMIDPLMHILRNAVDHGIESPDRRQRLGKSPTGRITLDFAREGNTIIMRCQDDGAGLDLAAIRRAAEERGLLAPDKPMGEDELARLILLPGFSTYGKTTQTSGRGIGMDVVYTQLLDMKGSLRIQTKENQGCLMELRLPVTLISTHALLLRMRNQTYALSDRGVEQILYSGIGKIQTLGNIKTFRVDDNVYELTLLESLLNLPSDRRDHGRATPSMLLVREEKGTLRAVQVEEILDSRDLVVKNLGRYFPKFEGIIGATILGDGSVAPVLDLPELLRTRTEGRRPSLLPRTADRAEPRPHRQTVLAVDDSLSARRSMAQFVQDAGFEVRTAHDGLEAIEIIKVQRPDLILADLEMPRMNGLELTAHLRANAATHDLPIIMITSRSTDKHRREAATMGVNAYLTKPFAEDDLLEHIQKLLPRT